MRLAPVLFAGAFLLTACGGRQPLVAGPNLVVSQDQDLPSPARGDLVAADRVSLIGPLDTIQVDVFGVPDLTREVQVDASGRIALPLVGTLAASGQTSEELARSIEQALVGRFLRNPQVTVNLTNSVSQVVTVDGSVGEPGLYPVTNQMTLMRAIASAKGVTEFAKTNDVVILRTVNKQRMAGLYNLESIRRGAYSDPQIYANDVIVVGDSPSRRLFRDIISLAPLLSAPIIALIQTRN